MVAFWVNDDHGVAEADQLFTHQSGQVGLAHPGAAAHRNVELGGGEGHRLAALVDAQRDLPAARMEVGAPGKKRSSEQGGHPLTVGQGQRHVGVRAEAINGVGDGHADLAHLQQAVIVLGIADSQGVVLRQTQLAERRQQTAALGHPGGQDHQLAPVTHEAAVQAQASDHLQRGRLVGSVTGDQHLPAAMDHTAGAQPRAHGTIDGRGQPADADRGHQHRAVLGDERVDVILDMREHGTQLVHDPPRDQDHPDPPGARLGERGQGVGRDRAVGERAVVIDRHRPEVAERSLSHDLNQPVRPLGAPGTASMAAANTCHCGLHSASPTDNRSAGCSRAGSWFQSSMATPSPSQRTRPFACTTTATRTKVLMVTFSASPCPVSLSPIAPGWLSFLAPHFRGFLPGFAPQVAQVVGQKPRRAVIPATPSVPAVFAVQVCSPNLVESLCRITLSAENPPSPNLDFA